MRVLHLSRRRLLPALLLVPAALAAVLFFALRTPHSPDSISIPDGAGCAAYLEKLGWEVAPDPIETLQLRLPEDLKASCADYVALQKAQGLPFADYGGQTVCRYTFRLTNYPGGAHGRSGQPPPVRLCRYRRGCDAPGCGRRAVLLGFSEVTPRYSSRIRTAQGQTDHRRRWPRWMEIRHTCGRADVGIGPYESVCRGAASSTPRYPGGGRP